MTQDQHQHLIDLTWQYAAIIGITSCEGIMPEATLHEYRAKWPCLIQRSERGQPIFDEAQAVKWMAEMSGFSHDRCYAVLLEEWEV